LFLFAQSEWTNYRVETEYFPDNPYKTLAVDSKNNIWIGTANEGIYIFDGADWQLYNRQNTSGRLPTNRINSLVIDSFDTVYIGTNGSGLIIKTVEDEWFTYNTNYTIPVVGTRFPSNYINSIVIDQTGQVHVATDQGLVSGDFASSIPFYLYTSYGNPLPITKVTSIGVEYSSSDERIVWAGTPDGLVKIWKDEDNFFDDFNFHIYKAGDLGLSGNGITCLAIDKQNNKWVSVYASSLSDQKGLLKISADETTFVTYAAPVLLSNNIRGIDFETVNGNTNQTVWVVTEKGINKLENNSWTAYNNISQMISTNVYSLLINRDIKYFGTNLRLLSFDNVTWLNQSIFQSGIPDNSIQTMEFEPNSPIKWIGTLAGLSRFNGYQFTVYNTANTVLPSNDIGSLALDEKRNLWIGTGKSSVINGGLVKFSQADSTWTVYRKTDSTNPLESDSITKIVIGKDQTIWVGTQEQGGLYSISPDSLWCKYKKAEYPRLVSDDINDLYIDNDGFLWIATNSGISILNNEKEFLEPYNILNSQLTSNEIRRIKQDLEGFMWAVTGSGVAKLVNGKWKVYTTSLVNNANLKDICFDANNLKWITSSQGLLRTNELDWKLYNTTNTGVTNLPTNNLSLGYIENIIENGAIKSYKWITSDQGVIRYTGGNATFPPGPYLSLFQSALLSNQITISAAVNNILVDHVEFRLNNSVVPHQEIGKNLWLIDYIATKNESLNIRFTYYHPLGDSTINKNIQINEVSRSGSQVILDDDCFITSIHDVVGEEWFITEKGSEQNFPTYIIPFMANNLINHLVLQTKKEGIIQKKILGEGLEEQWENLTMIHNEQGVYTLLSEAGEYRIRDNDFSSLMSISNLVNYPNPFNPSTNISFTNHLENAKITIDIYDIKGRKVLNLYQGRMPIGSHLFLWDGTNQQQIKVGSGIYFVKISSHQDMLYKKILLLK